MKTPAIAASNVFFKPVLGLLPFEIRTPRRANHLRRNAERKRPKTEDKKELVTQTEST